MLKILVIRNDKIGDFMLAWPSFALLKSQYPDSEITALVPEYTAPLAKKCKWVDKILIDDKKSSFISDISDLSKIIKKQNFDLSISLFSESRTSMALWFSGIKQRIGPATKIAQIFLNKTLKQNRSLSLKPEYEYNLDLIKYFIRLNGDTPVTIPTPPYLYFDMDKVNTLKKLIQNTHHIPGEQKIIIIHPCTGGSAINFSIQQYAELVQKTSVKTKAYFIITAGPGELRHANDLSSQLKGIAHHVHESATGIIDFCQLINTCDLFISGSTGPLHIAGALNQNTCAIYPARRSATSLRWKTLNDEKKQIVVTAINDDMTSIDLKSLAENVSSLLNYQS